MKFAFIENRYKTIFWIAIAKELKSAGHFITWLVQNPIFAPNDQSVFVMPFPRRTDFAPLGNAPLEAPLWVRSADRFINYFGGNDHHYRHYMQAIGQWLDREKPDVVIGESTLFHELLAVAECQSRGIPYFHPSMPGYPGGRFSVYAYATKEPLGSNPLVPDATECLTMAEAIRKREKIPDYMLPPSASDPERAHPMPRSLRDRILIFRGYWHGERFNTPSPWRKWLLDRQVTHYLKAWQKTVSLKPSAVGKRFVLYPLQMQPEANLDVWGQKFRDQSKLVRNIANHLPDGWHLLVKANPKSKYELNAELMNVLQQHTRISPISFSESMNDVLQKVDLVCTVTGTVAVECVLSRKPVVQLGPGIVDNGAGCARLNEVENIPSIIRQIETGTFQFASDADRIRLVQRLYQTSYPGKVSDPVNLPSVMAKANVTTVARTIAEIAEKCV